jgi:hypothetical protein
VEPSAASFDFPSDDVVRSYIVVADRGGRERERITDRALDLEPAWSADGERIYFTRWPAQKLLAEDLHGDSEIYVLDLETRSLRRLTDNDVDDRLPEARPKPRSLPDRPEPRTGDVVVPDLRGWHLLFEEERRRFRNLGLTLKAVPFLIPRKGVLSIVDEQAPVAGSRVPEGTVVKATGSDLTGLYAGERFSAKVWRAQPDCKSPQPRGPMYLDLVDRVLRRGMSRERVLSLLGDPARLRGRALDWPLGQRSYIRVDCIYLRVEFDRRGRATRFRQVAG